MKTNLTKLNNRYRGPMESAKLSSSGNIIKKNFNDIKTEMIKLKLEVEDFKIQPNHLYEQINRN